MGCGGNCRCGKKHDYQSLDDAIQYCKGENKKVYLWLVELRNLRKGIVADGNHYDPESTVCCDCGQVETCKYAFDSYCIDECLLDK